MDKKTPLQKKLEEQFQALLPDKDAPPEVKEEVFQTLDLLNVVGEITGLFTDKFGKASAQAIDLISNKEDNSEKM